MKAISFVFFLFLLPQTIWSKSHHDFSIIESIDDYDFPKNYVEVSEEGLPRDHYLQLIQLINSFRFTLLPVTRVNELFKSFTSDSQARMNQPGGKCSFRRAYIQNQLKKMSIISGKILIQCPVNNGRLRLRDQVSGRYFTYSNFHDANIVAMNSGSGITFRVLDLQFQSNPVSLHDYLTEIEASQRIRPIRRRGSSRSLCYWSISTPFQTF
jgi:hypothetical protein